MKLQVSISAVVASATFTKFFKQMAFNPNEGQFAAWLFKLPELKLPSVRPAIHLYNHRFVGKIQATDTLSSVFTATERKLVVEYYAPKKIDVVHLDQFVPFIMFMCRKVVDTSPTFRAHFGEAKAQTALALFILTGKTVATTPSVIKSILDKLNTSDFKPFDPATLADITVEDLKNNNYNELEVAAKVNKMTRQWFENSDYAKEALKEARQQAVKDLRYEVKNNTGPFKFSMDKTKEVLTQSEAEDVLRIADKQYIVRMEWTLMGKTRSIVLPRSMGEPSYSQYLYVGTVTEFYKSFPKTAAFFILSTPQLTSAINERMRHMSDPAWRQSLTKQKQTSFAPGSPEREGMRKESWMAKYVSEKVLKNSKLFAAEDVHLWMKVQSLPAKAVIELAVKEKPVFTIEDVSNLRTIDIGRMAKAVGPEKSLTTMFKDVLNDTLFKRKFLSAIINEEIELHSPFGKIQTKTLAKNLAKDGAETARDTALLSAKDVERWTPVKQTIADFQKKITRKLPKLPELKQSEITNVYADLQRFVWGGHKVDFEILKVWDIPISAVQEKHLKDARAGKDFYVIENAFHGTSASAAGAILMSGFRMSTEFVKTAQSMGPVLYMAPNIDKSLQYIGDSFGRRSDISGIIFHGDLVVQGSTPPKHTRSLTAGTDWTRTGAFQTEEIGLVHPNTQFIVRKAYLMKRLSAATRSVSKTAGSFGPLIPVSQYKTVPSTLTKQLDKGEDVPAAATIPYQEGDRVVARSRKNKWHIGTVESVKDSAVKVIFDDEATAVVTPKDFKHLKILAASKRNNPKVLTDVEVEALRLSKRSP